jgi:hypothetical protein
MCARIMVYFVSLPVTEEMLKVRELNSHTSLSEPYTTVLLTLAGRIINI